MKKNIFISGIVLVIILSLAAALYFWSGSSKVNPTVSSDSEIIFFWGIGCPHCENVKEFVAENKIKEKISFAEAEIFRNKENQNQFISKMKACGINDEKKMGVPMLWVKEKCYFGDENIIKYFTDETNKK